MQPDAEPGSQAREATTAFEPVDTEGEAVKSSGGRGSKGGGGKSAGDTEKGVVEGRNFIVSDREERVRWGAVKGTRIGLIHLKEVHNRIATSEEAALRYARTVDVACGLLLLVAYVVASCWIFLAK